MTSTFFSNALSRPIDIPNDKVCGYRIKNYNTRNGWQSGLRAGLDNGVAPQKFSRFAYDWETKSPLVEPCSGNTNWYNHMAGDNLKPISNPTGRPFEITRPAYISGGTYTQTKQATVNIANDRAGVGNRTIIRPAFEEEAPMARSVFDFDRLQALDIEQAGTKVQLGESTLSKLFEVKVPDEKDTQWTEERDRLVRVLRTSGMNDQQIEEELRINKPLGREQRTVSKMQNIGTSGLGVSDKLKEIREEITAGKAQTLAARAILTGQIAMILDNQARVERLNGLELENISRTLDQLKAPRGWRVWDFPSRVVSGAMFNANSGQYIAYLMANLSGDRSRNKPVLSWDSKKREYKPVKITNLYKLNDGPKFLDLERREIDTETRIREKGLLFPGQEIFIPDPPVAGPVFGTVIPRSIDAEPVNRTTIEPVKKTSEKEKEKKKKAKQRKKERERNLIVTMGDSDAN